MNQYPPSRLLAIFLGWIAGDRFFLDATKGHSVILNFHTIPASHKADFTDQFGKEHESGYHHSIAYGEMLNEAS